MAALSTRKLHTLFYTNYMSDITHIMVLCSPFYHIDRHDEGLK